MPTAAQSLQSHEKGAALIEFAIVAPLLLMAFLALTGIGFSIRNHLLMRDAVKNAGRMVAGYRGGDASPSRLCNLAIGAITDSLSGSGLDASDLQVEVAPVQVEVDAGAGLTRTLSAVRASISRDEGGVWGLFYGATEVSNTFLIESEIDIEDSGGGC